jgi:mono/diheme cytochrome c family protein
MKNKTFAIKLGMILMLPLAMIGMGLSLPKFVATKMDFVSSAKGEAGANYAQYCARCHGGDGRAQTAKGKQTGATDLTKSRIGDAAGVRIIANGKELMPGYKGNLSADEMKALMGYVRGFRR